jgi:hypothetical protein
MVLKLNISLKFKHGPCHDRGMSRPSIHPFFFHSHPLSSSPTTCLPAYWDRGWTMWNTHTHTHTHTHTQAQSIYVNTPGREHFIPPLSCSLPFIHNLYFFPECEYTCEFILSFKVLLFSYYLKTLSYLFPKSQLLQMIFALFYSFTLLLIKQNLEFSLMLSAPLLKVTANTCCLLLNSLQRISL